MTKRNRPHRTSRTLGAALSALVVSGCLSVMPALAPKAKNVENGISAAFPFEHQYIEVMGSQMAMSRPAIRTVSRSCWSMAIRPVPISGAMSFRTWKVADGSLRST